MHLEFGHVQGNSFAVQVTSWLRLVALDLGRWRCQLCWKLKCSSPHKLSWKSQVLVLRGARLFQRSRWVTLWCAGKRCEPRDTFHCFDVLLISADAINIGAYHSFLTLCENFHCSQKFANLTLRIRASRCWSRLTISAPHAVRVQVVRYEMNGSSMAQIKVCSFW